MMLPLHTFGESVSENVIRDTVWTISGSPYVLQGDVQIYPGVTLTVQPGVEVVIPVGDSLIVGGELIARGEENNPISFHSDLTIPAYNQPAGIIFLSTAESARFIGGLNPVFSYDHENREIILTYESGSILEYCTFAGLPTAIELDSCYPYIAESTVSGCPYGIQLSENREIPLPQWFFLYHNTFEDCSQNPMWYDLGGSYYFPFALLTGNVIKDSVHDSFVSIYSSHMSGDTFLFLFDNQVINNNGIALDDNGPYTFLYADNNLIDGNNRGISAGNAVLLHNTVTNNLSTQNYSVERGAGIYLNGPRSVLFNNTIQSNAVSSEDYGDNIALRSKEGNQFTLRYNKLGNSNGDLFDIYLDTKYQGIDEDTSSNMSVDAAYNFWESRDTDNLSDHIYDHSDNFLAGTVSYSPVLSSEELQAIEDTQSDLTVPPTLLTPEANAFMPGTLTLNFSWAPVAGATKYLLCTNGHANIPTEAVRIMEVDGQTSAEITYFPFTSYAQKYIYWFVVAGNEKGWSLPSEIRKVYFSIDPYVVSGSVLDENEAPVADVYIKGEGEGVFSSETGTYSLIVRDESAGTGEGGEGYILSLKKRGFSDCYTFPRLKKSFDTFGDLTVISNAAKEQIYAVCGQALDSACGSITGIVVDENDNALSGAEVFVEPASGSIYYLDADNSPDFSLTRTGSSGRFVILNVAPGDYRISANLDGYSFDITDLSGGNFIGPYIRVYQNSITVDALVGSSESESGETDDDGTGSVGDGGGGGGGGCFISTTSGSL